MDFDGVQLRKRCSLDSIHFLLVKWEVTWWHVSSLCHSPILRFERGISLIAGKTRPLETVQLRDEFWWVRSRRCPNLSGSEFRQGSGRASKFEAWTKFIRNSQVQCFYIGCLFLFFNCISMYIISIHFTIFYIWYEWYILIIIRFFLVLLQSVVYLFPNLELFEVVRIQECKGARASKEWLQELMLLSLSNQFHATCLENSKEVLLNSRRFKQS